MHMRLVGVSSAALVVYLAGACTSGGKGGAEPNKPGPNHPKSASAPATPAGPKPSSPGAPAAPAAPASPAAPAAPGPNGRGESLIDGFENKIKKAAADPKTKEAVKSCKSEAEKYCKPVEKDPKALANCLKQNEAKLAPICKAEVEAYLKTHR